MTYQLVNQFEGVKRSDGWSIPFAIDNANYIRFKSDLADGVELKDAEGNTMSSADIETFLAGLK